MPSSSAAAGGAGNRSRRKLDRRTRTEIPRLAARGRRHPQPAVSLTAFQWASDRLQVPLWRDLLIVAAGPGTCASESRRSCASTALHRAEESPLRHIRGALVRRVDRDKLADTGASARR